MDSHKCTQTQAVVAKPCLRRYAFGVSSIEQLEAEVMKLPAQELQAFTSWFESFRKTSVVPGFQGQTFGRLRGLNRDQRRRLVVQSADRSAEFYNLNPKEVLPDILDD